MHDLVTTTTKESRVIRKTSRLLKKWVAVWLIE